MTASISVIIIPSILALIPFSFIDAGEDTEHSYAACVQRQREAAMEWTDKDILAAEHTELRREYYGEPRARQITDSPVTVENLPRFVAV